jgi:hypothetical protein
MLHAVEAPVLKLAAVAGAALLLGAFAVPRDHKVVQRLELHAPKIPTAIYETAWERGDVRITLRDGKAKPVTFQKRSYHWGCEWLSVEHIVPDGPNRYFYTYDEEKLWCAEGAPPSIATPRVGYAVVVDTE